MKFGVSYLGNRMANHFKNDLILMKEKGLSQILLTYSENDMEFYSGTVKEMIQEAVQFGFEVYLGPWSVGGVFGGEAYSKFTAFQRDALQVLSNGEKYPAACMNHPLFWEFFQKWIDSALSLEPDAVFFDEPHFFVPGWKNQFPDYIWGCRCDSCQELFQSCYGIKMPGEENYLVKEFKRNSIISFIEKACEYSKKKREHIKTSVCLITNEFFLETDFPYQIAGIKNLDETATDPYWGLRTGIELQKYLNEEFTKACRILNEIKREQKKSAQIWIKNFLVKSGTEWAIPKAVDIAKVMNVDSVMAWSFMGTKVMSSFASDNPDLVWENFVNCVNCNKE